jgi:hypothetical protein
MTIESILTEWRYRLKKGYPETHSDYNILRDVLTEMTALSETDKNMIVQRSMGLTEQPTDELETPTNEINFNELGLSADIVRQIEFAYTALSNVEKAEFKKNYRVHTIESFVDSGYKVFEKFFMVNVGGARGGMGNGEIQILLGVANSKPGGTAQHDIVMPAGEWEVKELKDGKFDPAKAGAASNFALTEKIKSFYKDIVDPINHIGDPYEQLKHLVNTKSHDDLKRLLMIFETRFSEAIDVDKLSSMEWKKTAFHNWYEGFRELHKIFHGSELDSNVTDTRLTLDVDGNKESFWIDDDDVNDIRQKAGSNDTADIYIGEPVTNANNNITIWFNRIERNEFITNPETFISELNIIKSNFFNEILGLIWYDHRNPVPHIGNPTDFVIDTLSQGRYRFVKKLIPANNGYSYIEHQS